MIEAWFAITTGLLLVSGVAKVVDPAPTGGALEAAGLPHPAWSPRALGVVEVVAAAGGLIMGGAAAWGVAALYASFAVFVGYALWRKLPLQSCGCFGKAETPPTMAHLVVNVTAATAALVVARQGVSLLELASGVIGLLYFVFAAIGVGLTYLILSELPRLRVSRR